MKFFSNFFKRSTEKSFVPDIDTEFSIPNNQKSLAVALLNGGIAKAKANDYLGAIEDFTKALEINPTDATI